MNQLPEISALELKEWMDSKRPHLLLDVRELNEHAFCHIEGSMLIPLRELPERASYELPQDVPIVVHCRSGGRSARAIEQLQAMGWKNLFNLKGGILAWSDEVDSTIPKY